jgi:3-oxoacyl-[acyl-carrier protein] reductase
MTDLQKFDISSDALAVKDLAVPGREFKNRVALVTGAARGIGRAIALELAARGCKIAFNYHTSEEQADSLVRRIRQMSTDAMTARADVSDYKAMQHFAGQVRQQFGQIDYLVNNAGIVRDVSLVMMTETDWDEVVDINLKGAFCCTKAVLFAMMKKKSGRILNIASISGLVGQKGQVNYASSKSGIIGFTKSLAKELAPIGITVNGVAAGFIDTDMTGKISEKRRESISKMIPLGRFGTADEIARICAFLLSEDARYITGQIIQVDGGLAM